jgi:hypothetical protein
MQRCSAAAVWRNPISLAPPLTLVRTGRYGTAVIDVVNAPPSLQEGAVHSVQLTRDTAGDLTIGLDGKGLLRA